MAQPIKKQQIIGLFGEHAGNKLLTWLDPCCNTFCEAIRACGGGGLTSITYNDLVALAGAGNLKVGAFYLITDFRMVTYIQFSGGGIGSEDIHNGKLEPMIVQAASPSDIDGTIISTVNPTDIINYSLLFSDREWDAVAGQSTGIITYREDTINKNSRDFDFRNINFRRWETVNGSGIYDSFTNTGNGFVDIDAYPSNCYGNKIHSPLFAYSDIGVPYFLDNTVFFSTGAVIGNSIEIAWANTFSGSTDANNITACFGNLILDNCQGNQLGSLQNNIISDKLKSNICYEIIDNNIDSCQNNNCIIIGENIFSGDIADNCCNFIIRNTSSNVGAGINNNQLNVIQDNIDFGAIAHNSGVEIISNIRCEIQYNSVYSIIENSTSVIGSRLMIIERNSGYAISQNTSTSATGFELEFNNVNSVQGNTFDKLTGFNANTGNTFTNNVFDNIPAGATFKNNIFPTILSCVISDGVNSNNFIARITNKTFTPTLSMIADAPTITTYDYITGDVEQVLSGGVISYVAF